MAVIMRVVDDFDGTTEAPYTIRFGIDGKLYDIDVSEENDKRIRTFFDELIAVARVAKPGTKAPKRSRRDEPDDDDQAELEPADEKPATTQTPEPEPQQRAEPQLELEQSDLFDEHGGIVDKELRAAIREWAKKHGHDIGDRGRIPRNIVEEYMAAHA